MHCNHSYTYTDTYIPQHIHIYKYTCNSRWDSLSPTTEPAVSELLVASHFLCSPCEIVGGGRKGGGGVPEEMVSWFSCIKKTGNWDSSQLGTWRKLNKKDFLLLSLCSTSLLNPRQLCPMTCYADRHAWSTKWVECVDQVLVGDKKNYTSQGKATSKHILTERYKRSSALSVFNENYTSH